jgi:hypothetical protein
VCGAQVFFYSNEFGSRVYFDELGPPWPKHPCTDNSSDVGHFTPSPPVGLRNPFAARNPSSTANDVDRIAYVVTEAVKVGPRRHVTLTTFGGDVVKLAIEPPSPPLWSIAVIRDFELHWYDPRTGEHGRPSVREVF